MFRRECVLEMRAIKVILAVRLKKKNGAREEKKMAIKDCSFPPSLSRKLLLGYK